MDGADVKAKTKDYMTQVKEKIQARRSMITDTQSHNKDVFNNKMSQSRMNIDNER